MYIVVRERLDDHRRPIVLQGAPRVSRHSNGIPHIVEAVEKCDQVKRFVGVTHRIGHLEPQVRYAGSSSSFTRCPNGIRVVVVPYERRVRICLRHQDSTCSVTAADISHFRAGLEFCNHTVEGWEPRRDEISVIASAEEPFGSTKETRMMFAPFHALSRPNILESTA